MNSAFSAAKTNTRGQAIIGIAENTPPDDLPACLGPRERCLTLGVRAAGNKIGVIRHHFFIEYYMVGYQLAGPLIKPHRKKYDYTRGLPWH